MNTIFQADQIIVLEEGHIVETGTHHELLVKNGVYTSMVKTYEVSRDEVRSKEEFQRSDLDAQAIDKPRSTSSYAQSPPPQLQDTINSSIFFRLLSFLNGSWNLVALSVLLSSLTIGSSVALIGTSAWLISTAALHPSIADLGVSIVGVRFFGISRGVFRYLERLVSHNVTFRLLARLRVWFYEKLEPLAPARLLEYKSGDLLARVIGDVETLENFYVRVISPSLTAILIAAGVSFFFVFFYPPLVLILNSLFLTLGLILPVITQIVSRAPGQKLIIQRAEIQSQLVDGIQGLADLLAFGRGADRLKQISSAGDVYGSTQKQMALISGVHSGLSTFLTNFGLWLVLLIVIPQVATDNINGVMLGTFALITLASFEAVTPLPLAAQMWNSSREAAKRLFDVVDAEPAVHDSGQPSAIGDQMQIENYEIQFANLTFTYPIQSAPAVENITFTVSTGKSIAIVGPSGAGKSTLANLLLRFWDYNTGKIALGGRSLKVLKQDEVRKRFALVSQNSYFFNTTVRENLRLARHPMSQAEMEEAARAAQIHEFIINLPKAYDTFIGEQGLRLSGGERQRLAIARALLKNAPILIFDEPTANLDPGTEKQVLNTLFETMRGKTSLLITHRLVGLENMDQILVMDHGKIVECGSHKELVTNNGLYRHLWDLQNRIFYDIYG